MTILIAVSVRDRAVDAFGQPAFVPHLGLAVREFSDAVRKPETQFNAHPDDFDLYKVGEFDQDTGLFTRLDRPEMIAIGKSFVSSSS